MIPMHELHALKAEYEAELTIAKAKVAVIDDIIALAECHAQVATVAPVQEVAEPVAEHPLYSVDGNY